MLIFDFCPAYPYPYSYPYIQVSDIESLSVDDLVVELGFKRGHAKRLRKHFEQGTSTTTITTSSSSSSSSSNAPTKGDESYGHAISTTSGSSTRGSRNDDLTARHQAASCVGRFFTGLKQRKSRRWKGDIGIGVGTEEALPAVALAPAQLATMNPSRAVTSGDCDGAAEGKSSGGDGSSSGGNDKLNGSRRMKSMSDVVSTYLLVNAVKESAIKSMVGDANDDVGGINEQCREGEKEEEEEKQEEQEDKEGERGQDKRAAAIAAAKRAMRLEIQRETEAQHAWELAEHLDVDDDDDGDVGGDEDEEESWEFTDADVPDYVNGEGGGVNAADDDDDDDSNGYDSDGYPVTRQVSVMMKHRERE